MKVCPSCHHGSLGQSARCPDCDYALEQVPVRSGDELEGMVVDGKYQLDECVGEGAMGWVYRGTHLTLGSTVAVKVMKPVADDDGSRVARFEREARASSRMNHPHILMIHDFGRTAGGMLYIVSEFLEGVTLSQLLDSGEQVPLGRAVNIFNQVLAAVDEAHSSRLIHRDLKPENIMLMQLRSGEDFTKVLDFGIARIAEQEGARLTQQGELCGTPAYMAPEQIRGKDADERSDLYALGLVFYELLAGRPPFQSDSVMEMLAMQLHTVPVPLRQAAPDRDLPEALEKVLSRCLSKDPAERYGSVNELREAVFMSLKELDEAQTACHACHLHRPAWSNRCVSCGLGSGGGVARARSQAGLPKPPPNRQTRETVAAVPSDAPRRPAEPLVTAKTLHVQTGAGAVSERGSAPSARPLFVGREPELEQVASFLEGDRGVLEVVAPLGTGKTTLLDAAALRAAEQGWTVLRAGADPLLNRTPWFPVREMVRQVLGLSDGPTSLGDLRRHAIERGLVSDDVPGLADLFGVDRTTDHVRPSIRMRETQAAALRVLLGPELDAPRLCVVLDDVDDYDGASLAFLHSFSERLAAGRSKMMMGVVSSVLPADGPQETIYLGPLDQEQVHALVTSFLAGQPVPLDLVRSVFDTSGGNPLYASLTLRRVADGQHAATSDIGELVAQRVEALSAGTRRVLGLVCLVGNSARLELLREAYGDATDVEGAVQELIARGFLVRASDVEVQVSHPRIGELVREGLESAERSALHRQIYDALGRAGAGFLARARHAFEAQLGDESLTLLQQAGELSAHWLDDEGAAVHFRHALHVARWELLLGEDDPRFLVLSLKLGDALTASGHFLASEMILKEAIASSAQHTMLRIRLHGALARLLARRDLLEEAAVVWRQAISLALEAGVEGLLLEGYLELAEVMERRGMRDEAIAELDEALLMASAGASADGVGGPPGVWRLLLRCAELRHGRGEREAPLRMAAQALEQAQRERSLEGQGRSQLAMARWLGPKRLDAAEEAASAAVAAFRRLGDRRSVAECLLCRARLQPANRLALAEEAQDLARQVQWSEGLAEANRMLTEAA